MPYISILEPPGSPTLFAVNVVEGSSWLRISDKVLEARSLAIVDGSLCGEMKRGSTDLSSGLVAVSCCHSPRSFLKDANAVLARLPTRPLGPLSRIVIAAPILLLPSHTCRVCTRARPSMTAMIGRLLREK
jgi:hypothetical protein